MTEKEIKENIKQLTVQIETPNEKGTGVLIIYKSRPYILTVHHCIYGKGANEHQVDANDVKFIFYNRAELYAVDIISLENLVLLEINAKDLSLKDFMTVNFARVEYELNYYIRGFPIGLKRAHNFRAKCNDDAVDQKTFKIEMSNITSDTSGDNTLDYIKGISGSGVFTAINKKIYLVGLVNALATQSGTFNAVLCTNLNISSSAQITNGNISAIIKNISSSLKKTPPQSISHSAKKRKKIYIVGSVIIVFFVSLFLLQQNINNMLSQNNQNILEKIEEKTSLGKNVKPFLVQLLGDDYIVKLSNQETYTNLLKLLDKKTFFEIIEEQKKLQETVKSQTLDFENYQKIEDAFRTFRYSDVRKIIDDFLEKHKGQIKNISKAHYLKGLSYKEELNFRQAEEEFEKAYILDGKNYTLVNDYAQLLLKSDKYEKSLKILKTITSDNNNNSKIFASLNIVALNYKYLAKYQKAEQIYIEIIALHEKLFGKENKYSHSLYNNLAGVYSLQNKDDKAIPLLLKAIKIIKKYWGDKNQSLATTYMNLGLTYCTLGKYKESEKFLLKSLETEKKIRKKEHPNMATIYNNLGLLYSKMKLYLKSEEFYLKDLSLWKRFWGEKHSHIGITYLNLANLYMEMGKVKKAKLFYNKALTIEKKIFDEPHHLIEDMYGYIGNYYMKQKLFHEAKQNYSKRIESKETRLGKGHKDILNDYYLLIKIETLMGNQKEVDRLYLQLFKSRDDIFYHFFKEEKYDEAIDFYNKKLNFIVSTSNDKNSLFHIYEGLGSVWLAKGETEKALDLYYKSLDIYISEVGEEDASLAITYSNISIVLLKQKKYNKALKYCQKSLKIEKKKLPSNHPKIIKIEKNLRKILQKIEKKRKHD